MSYGLIFDQQWNVLEFWCALLFFEKNYKASLSFITQSVFLQLFIEKVISKYVYY